MDAMAVLCTLKGQPVFMARSDIFRKKFTARILYYIKMLPVYRMRDGYESLKLNDETFRKTVDVLKNKNGVVILPEGNHDGHRRLRQLKKGISRIAFSAEEVNDFNLRIRIIPVGLEYSHYFRFRQVLTVVYGKPIEVSDYKDTYLNNQPKAHNDLRDKLTEGMKNLMVHIETEENYEAVDELRSLVNGRYSDSIKYPKIFRDRVLIEKLNAISDKEPQKLAKLFEKTLFIKQTATSLKVVYRYLEKERHGILALASASLVLLASLPLYIYGMVFNYIFIEVPKIPLRKISDQQFHSSVRYALSLILAFVFMPIYAVIAFLILKPWYLALAFIVSIPVSGLLAWNWSLLFRRVEGGIRIRKLIRSGNTEFIKLKKEYKELMEIISTL